jgi:hypothetical protein
VKTHKNLFSQIVTFENLLLAAQKAAAGKREQFNVMDFFYRLEENLWRLQEELQTQTYRPGAYRLAFSRPTGFSHASTAAGGKCAPLQTAPAAVAGISAGQSRTAAGELGGARGAGRHLLFIAGVGVRMTKFSTSFRATASYTYVTQHLC